MQSDVMYRSSPESNKQTAETFTNLLGLNIKCFQEMYLDTCASMAAGSTSSPSISPTSSNGTSGTGSLMLSPVSMSPTSSSSNSSNTSTSSSSGCGAGMGLENMTAFQQQQLLAAHQQHLAAAAVAQHHLAMAAAAGNQQSSVHVNGNVGGTPANTNQQQQHDEISKSLKMFAMLTAYSNGNETPAICPQQMPHSPVDAVMQDFACNGYICDELNRYQLGMHLSNNAATAGANTTNLLNSSNGQLQVNSGIASSNAAAAAAVAAASLNQHQLQQLQQHNLNINFNNNFWKMLPTHMQQHSNAVTAAAAAAAAATAAAAVNMDYNCNQKKLPKRYNGAKNEKYSSAKHCVFCENNNEPVAVVKSHAVRDSLGRVLCPKLRTYICPICKASGDMAHTVKYCPQKPIITMEDAIKAESFRLAKDTYYKQQMKV
ncbi:protein nanos [Calliphora vicina]|uniref:protein nanos n=1 Tax=Calliphora vicina TaxID=7373 RepID=UPI00325AB604